MRSELVPDLIKCRFEECSQEEFEIITNSSSLLLLEHGIKLSVSRNGNIFTEFSPSLLSTKNNHNMLRLSPDELQEQIEYAGKILKEAGICRDINEADIFRFHSAIDCIHELPHKRWMRAMRLLDFNGKYQKEVGGTTLYYNCDSMRYVVYDKIRANEAKQYLTPEEFSGSNVLRIEQRIDKPRPYQTITKTRYMSECHKALPIINEKFYQKIKEVLDV